MLRGGPSLRRHHNHGTTPDPQQGVPAAGAGHGGGARGPAGHRVRARRPPAAAVHQRHLQAERTRKLRRRPTVSSPVGYEATTGCITQTSKD